MGNRRGQLLGRGVVEQVTPRACTHHPYRALAVAGNAEDDHPRAFRDQ